MKSMTKLMVVAMLLVAALVVAPVAARTTDGTLSADKNLIYTIAPGNTIYVGEKNLNFATNQTDGPELPSEFGIGFTKGWLVHFSSTTDNNVDKTIAISNAHDFELTKSAVGTTTGTYYVFKEAPFYATGDDKNSLGSVVVDIPSITLDVVLNDSTIDSVNSKSVTRDSMLAFKLTNNLAGFSGLDVAQQPKMKIEVSAPGGGKLTTFGGQELDTIYANGTTEYIYNILLKGDDKTRPVEAGTYSAQAKWYSTKAGASFYDKGYDSNTVTFEVSPKKLAVSSSKDKVVRGNSFTVTVTGESKKDYIIFVKAAGSLKETEYPLIASGQPSVAIKSIQDMIGDKYVYSGNETKDNTTFDKTNAWVQTNAAGKRDVRFETTQKTDDRQFTIRVQDPKDKTNYDEVKVRVDKGEVTITASGTGVYYIGEEITLSGTNTDSDNVYLFLTGPNLGTNGVKISDAKTKVVTTDPSTFTREDVEADDTWSYKWDTSDLSQVIDAGGYTVYAVATNVSKDDLGDYKYATVSVTLKSAFVTATSSGATIAKGDKLLITGTAQGDPSSVYVWIFGKNYRALAKSASVESDGSFEYKLETGETKDLTAGQYFVVVQHPMTNGFGVDLENSDSTVITGQGINDVDLAKLQASDAATALINALDSPNIDDTYTKLTFVVEEPQIFIDPIGDKEAGSKFTISGTTNLAVGDQLIIDVTSAAFQPSKKTEASGFGSTAGNVVVEKGDGANKWSFEIDATGFKPDQYIVKIESVETDTTATANFNVVEAKPTTQPTGTATVQPTGTATTATTTSTTTTPTQSPGFGALVALAGLGAVAFLVLRRN